MTDQTPAQELRAAADRVRAGTPEIACARLAWAISQWLNATAEEMTAAAGTEYANNEYASWTAALTVARTILGSPS